MLVRLLYASRAAEGTNEKLIDSIMTESKLHNPQAGITGILCFNGSLFLQVLEGSRLEVSRLYSRIANDKRHKEVELLHFEEVSERIFSNWTMGQVNLNKLNPSTLLKYSEKPELDPFTAPGKVTIALLGELIATAAIAGRA